MNSPENSHPTETLHSPTAPQRRPSHRQEPSETHIPFLSTPSRRHAVPPPAFIPDKPAPWQLGRHSYYFPGTEDDQQSPTLSGQPHSPGYLDVHVQHQVNAFEVEEVHNVEDNVEEELHRRLKARQVR